MSTGKVLTILGAALGIIGVVLMGIGATMPTFAFYAALTIVGVIIGAAGKKMEDREAEARFNSGR